MQKKKKDGDAGHKTTQYCFIGLEDHYHQRNTLKMQIPRSSSGSTESDSLRNPKCKSATYKLPR